MDAHFNLPLTRADAEQLHDFLLDRFARDAYREGDFVLSSGARSSYYLNGKQVTLTAEGAVAIARSLLFVLPSDTEAVAGLTLGADPIVCAVSAISVYENRPLSALIVRKEAKGYGTRAYIEGPILEPGAKVVVLEDVVTTGQSALKAVQRLREAGYGVDRVIALVDRNQGGRELYGAHQLEFQALFAIEEIRQRARDRA